MGLVNGGAEASSAVVFVLGFCSITLFSCGCALALPDGLLEPDFEYDTRPHDLGLSKIYTAEFKRLPVYEFGLGKRFEPEDKSAILKDYEEYPYDDEEDSMPELDLYTDDSIQSVEKRQNAYNFGLGKRHRSYDFGLGKRGRSRYDFGLGKRSSPSSYHRDRLYNMGLGKRTRLYSFGLGKRPYSQGAVGSRFNFGLGKRSDDPSRTSITKREVHANRDESRAKSAEAGPSQPEASKQTDGSHVTKRSPSYGYSMESADDASNNRHTVGFSRQFRKPIYNFGLGKRTSSTDNSHTSDNSFKSSEE